ncbi:MAG: ATP-dependent endonuclease [Novosphingobium sp.]
MARIRAIEVSNFRSLQEFTWFPSSGINCLIGPGDSGKSTVLDAIDLCLGARRNLQISDADFHNLDTETPITISITIGELDDGLKKIDTYGSFLRGFDAILQIIEDEPEAGMETVLTLRLTVTNDLEPSWTLVSDRAAAAGVSRYLTWADRVRLAPTRVGAVADYNLSWRRGSVLNRLSEEKADASAALAKAAREARTAFGADAGAQLQETLGKVAAVAKSLGVPVGQTVQAMLDAHSVSFGGGTISLHDEAGIPLRGLGTGSTRLLVAGLQGEVVDQSSIILVDELEHGLEPHRLIRFIGSIGAKAAIPPLQAFVTTHSPVALREFSGDQLFVLREAGNKHSAKLVGSNNPVQGTIRRYAEAFLAPSVVICEGASEVGLVRGIDQFRVANGYASIGALGVALVDCGGGGPDQPFDRAAAFHALGYRVAVIRDDDKPPTEAAENAFKAAGGHVTKWGAGRALEQELFLSLNEVGVTALLDKAIELHGEALVDQHTKSASGGAISLLDIQTATLIDGISAQQRQILGVAAKSKSAAWFKSVSLMEAVALEIIAPNLANSAAEFLAEVNGIFAWAENG